MTQGDRNQAWPGLSFLVVLAGCIILVILTGTSWASEWAELILPEEAALAEADPGTRFGKPPINIGLESRSLGPLIEVLEPSGGVSQNPVAIKVHFTAQASPVELSTLKVDLLKFITIDLTDRVKPYASVTGIDVREAKLPSGKHHVRISIADQLGAISTKDVYMEVH